MILLACATANELQFWTPRHGVEVLVTGIGPVDAASRVAHALGQLRYKLVVSAGIGGALGDAAAVGEGVVVTDETYDLRLEGGAPIPLPEGMHVAETAAADTALCAQLQSRGLRGVRGITAATVTSTDASAAALASRGFGVETMEGFAVLRAAELAGVPAVELRGISNRAGDRARSGWSFARGVEGLDRAVRQLFDLMDAAHVPPKSPV